MDILALIFFTLFVIHLSFGFSLQIISHFHKNKRGVKYIYLSFYARSILFLGPASLLFFNDISWSLYTTGPLKVLILPLLFLYFKKLHLPKKSLQKNDLAHFIPFIFEIFFTLIIVQNHGQNILNLSNMEISSLLDISLGQHFYYNLLAITARSIAFFQSVIYAYLISKSYQKIKTDFLKHNSYLSYFNLRWIKWVSYILIINGIISGLELFGLYSNPGIFIFTAAFLIFNAFFFMIHSILQNEFTIYDSNNLNNIIAEQSDSTQHSDVQNILAQFKNKALYLKPDISLQEASYELCIAKYKLTNYIKSGGYDNFYQFVNQMRIDKSKELLINILPNHSIDSVVGEAGFNSRATFYRVFKDYCGMTPTEYIQKAKV